MLCVISMTCRMHTPTDGDRQARLGMTCEVGEIDGDWVEGIF
jgi:hypothetical protein